MPETIAANLEVLILAASGGLLVQVLNLLELASVPKSERPRGMLYWLQFVVWPLVGALLGYVYVGSQTELSPLLALNVGLSAPLIVKGMAAAVPATQQPINPGAGA